MAPAPALTLTLYIGVPRPSTYLTFTPPRFGAATGGPKPRRCTHGATPRAHAARRGGTYASRWGARCVGRRRRCGLQTLSLAPTPTPTPTATTPTATPTLTPTRNPNQAPALRRWREVAAEGVARRRIIGRLSRPEARALGSWRAYAAARGDATRKLRWAITLWPRAGAKGYRALTLTSIWSSQTLTPPSYHPFPGGPHGRCGARRWRAPLRGGAKSARRARRGRGAAARPSPDGRTRSLPGLGGAGRSSARSW